MESILTSIKKLLGIPAEHTEFDADVIMHINSVFMVLTQIGIGPTSGFSIEDESTTWDDYIPDVTRVQAIKSYMYAKVRLIFDPPQSSAHIECLKQTVSEFEWRLYTEADLYN